MSQQEILRKIGGIIAELKEQYTYLEANCSSFNDLELELFMANANFLTDHIAILKKIHGQAKIVVMPATSTNSSTEKVSLSKPVIPDYFSEEEHLPFADDPLSKKLTSLPASKNTEDAQEPILAAEPAQQETFLLPELMTKDEASVPFMMADTSFTAQKSVSPENEIVKEAAFAEPKVELVSAIEAGPEIQYPQETSKPKPIVFVEDVKPEVAKPEPVKQAFIKPQPEPVLTLNQRIAAQKNLEQPKAKVAVAGKPVQDLPLLITLNDKLLFVKELFNGYNLAYSEAINILNRYTDFEQAEQFLKANYADKNNWKDKPATAERFYELLKKRFSES